MGVEIWKSIWDQVDDKDNSTESEAQDYRMYNFLDCTH